MKGLHTIRNYSFSPMDYMDMERLGASKCYPNGNRVEFDQDTYVKNEQEIEDVLQSTGDKSFHYIEWQFSKSEILSSEYCWLKDTYYCGYPSPEETYDAIVFDPEVYCSKCGTEMNQINDYRVRKVAKHEMWGFFSWVFDVVFVSLDLYNDVFKTLGVDCRRVRMPSGKLREDVVQLVIPVIDEDIPTEMIGGNTVCPHCGKIKYWRKDSLPFFSLHTNPLPYIYMTKEYFGPEGMSGRAYRYILISTYLAKILLERKAIKWDFLVPCKSFRCQV